MKYFYYPGCSLKGTARSYEESLLAVFETLGIPLTELPNWNCCGATAYMSVNEREAFALAARNLALAAAAVDRNEPVSIVAPCNACYLALTKAQRYMRDIPDIGRPIIDALAEVGLWYREDVRVRYPLEVLCEDVSVEKIERNVVRPLEDTVIACYYGCQIVRPYACFDDDFNPMSMDALLRAAGAQTIDWPLKSRCCGASLTGTVEEAGLRRSHILLSEARKRGADIIATCCPLCQFNLECYQPRIRRRFHEDVRIPVAFFTQLLGLALGLGERELGLHRTFVPVSVSAAPV